MKILLYLYYPFIENSLPGGAQIVMRQIVDKLSDNKDFTFRILCPKIPNDTKCLSKQNVEILPLLNEFKSNRNIDEIATNFRTINRHAQWADIVWSIDRAIPIKTKKPLILSINAVCYSDSQNALFSMNWDKIITPSDFIAKKIQNIMPKHNWHGDILPEILCISPIMNKKFEIKTDFTRLEKYFKWDTNKKYILFPHRPDKGKMHNHAANVLKSLLNHSQDYILLVPKSGGESIALKTTEEQVISDFLEYADTIGVKEHVILHDWIQHDDMPYYYSTGIATLMPTVLQETFGMTLVDSILCGCPVISSGAGALGETVPKGNGHEIMDFNDPDTIATTIINKISGIDNGINIIKQKYDANNVARQYADCFQSAKKTNGYYYEK